MELGQILVNFVMGFADKYPIIATVIMIIGGLRLVFKPMISIARSVVEYTPSTSDNAALDKFEGGKFYKSMMYVLDLFASIKPVK
jgi:hypothetical protein